MGDIATRIGAPTTVLKTGSVAWTAVNGTEQLSTAIPIATPSGKVVPLSSLAKLVRVNAPPQINRSSRQRSVTLQLTPPSEVAIAIGSARISAASGRGSTRRRSSIATSVSRASGKSSGRSATRRRWS